MQHPKYDWNTFDIKMFRNNCSVLKYNFIVFSITPREISKEMAIEYVRRRQNPYTCSNKQIDEKELNQIANKIMNDCALVEFRSKHSSLKTSMMVEKETIYRCIEKLDYIEMRQCFGEFASELAKYVCNPNHLERMRKKYWFDKDVDIMDVYECYYPIG
jgi:hypothetical protein